MADEDEPLAGVDGGQKAAKAVAALANAGNPLGGVQLQKFCRIGKTQEAIGFARHLRVVRQTIDERIPTLRAADKAMNKDDSCVRHEKKCSLSYLRRGLEMAAAQVLTENLSSKCSARG